jgi:uncharacterized peroxidase-related enzyme
MFDKSKMRRADKEIIAVIVSKENACDYCINHHAEALLHYWKDKEKIDALCRDYKTAGLSEKLIVILDYAVLLTRSPGEIKKESVDALRHQGLSDEEILQVNLVVSYFNFVNRIAKGLGVEFSQEEVEGYKY